MSPDEQRIAIAEACGWKWEPHTNGTRLRRPDGTTKNENYAESWRVPDYLNDLNAMHEVLHVLTEAWQVANYRLCLASKLGPTCAIDATAAQRAEAFLRTIGKWREDKP
jgi:hypothetical protein